ncbi:MAG: TIGR00730 family Rossman fold protein [Myxococcota bacterium]|nr:TIGR00730 family Rossman fold protein [Myxococcota bacterium]
MRITVFAGSSRRSAEPYVETARALGAEIARRGHLLVYGGGRTGLMGAVADAAIDAGGRVHGVILREFIEQDVHHLGLEELYTVEDMRLRKAGLDERADAFVTLPGGFGTFEEMAEILSFRKLGLHHRPLVLLNTRGFFDPWVRLVENAVEAGFEKPERLGYLALTDDPVEALDLCERERGSG